MQEFPASTGRPCDPLGPQIRQSPIDSGLGKAFAGRGVDLSSVRSGRAERMDSVQRTWPERAVDRTASTPSVGRAPMDSKAGGHQSKASSSGWRQMQHSTQSSEPSPDGGPDRLGRNLAAVKRRLTDSQRRRDPSRPLRLKAGRARRPSHRDRRMAIWAPLCQAGADGRAVPEAAHPAERDGQSAGRPVRRTALAAIGTIQSSTVRTICRPANSVKSLSSPLCFVSN
jgi:hypothetical protein